MKIKVADREVQLEFHDSSDIGGWKTMAILILDNKGTIESFSACALCHPGDVFVKRIGRKIALTRLLDLADEKLAELTQERVDVDSCRKVRGLVWAEYLKVAKV